MTCARLRTANLTGIAVLLAMLGGERLLCGGQPEPTNVVLLPDNAGPVLKFAATELQKYARQISGANLTVGTTAEAGLPRAVLSSGSSPNPRAGEFIPGLTHPAVSSDDYKLKTVGQTILIIGGSDRAVLFGVYDLLERIGCRWFAPLEEHVPTVETLKWPELDVCEEPVFHWRALEFIAGCDPACVDWMTKLRLNVAWPEKYVPNSDMTANELQLEAAAVPAMTQRGLTIFWGGHILPVLFPIERYTDHPEYFAQIDGKRLAPEVDQQSRMQLCTSNPDVMRIVSENTVQFLRNHPWIDTLVLWGNDTNDWCECAACRALEPNPDRKSSFAGLDRSATYCRMIRIVNAAVMRELPGRRIAFNHYYNLEDLPRDEHGHVLESVLPDRSVLSNVDAYRQCDRHAFTDADCPKGKRIEPITRAWAPYFSDSVSWSYYWSWNFMKGLPVPMVHKIPDDFRFLRSLGVNGVIDNVSLVPSTFDRYDPRPGIAQTDHWRYNALNFYVYAKAAWNPDIDVDATVADFITHYYGTAAAPMTEFWRLMEQSWTRFGQDPEFLPEDDSLRDPESVHGWVGNIRYVIPNQQVFDRLEAYLREARHLAAATYDQPLKPVFMPYVERVQLLERAIATWPTTKADTKLLHK